MTPNGYPFRTPAEEEQWDEERQSDTLTEKWYERAMLPQVKKQIREFKAEMGDWGLERRLEYLLTAQHAFEVQLIELKATYEAYHELREPYINRAVLLPGIENCKKHLRTIRREMRRIYNSLAGQDSSDNEITNAMIERARQYPIGQLVEVGRNGMARCVVHEDKRPSMDCRKGFVHCYACGFSGDSIAVYMQLHGGSFPDAVRALQ